MEARVRRKPGRPFEAHIEDLSHDGRGVARIAGKTVFVEGALPGEVVTAVLLRQRGSHDDARLAEVVAASPERVVARCPHFGACGGCTLQHLSGAAQLAAKERSLFDALERIGRAIPARRYAPLIGPAWHYRRRARLGVRYVNSKGRVLVGFRERHHRGIAEMDSCEVLAGGLGALLGPLATLISSLSIVRRLPQIEVAVGDDRTALVFRVLDPPSGEDLAALRDFGRERGVDIWLQPGGPATAQPLDGAGPPPVYRLPSQALEIGFLPTDFIQVNGPMNEAMVARALELLAPEPGERVLDLFCGLGNFSLALASTGAHVCGIEGDEALVERAAANARRNGLEVEFHVADLFEDCRALHWARRSCDRILLDPPRAGAEASLALLGALAPRRVLYVSCHPGTLARDAGILVHQLGYRFSGAGVMDMFPHTTHVESIAVFDRP